MQLADSISPQANERRKLRLAELSAEHAIDDPSQSEKYRLTECYRSLPNVEQNFQTALKFGKDALPEELRAQAVGTGSQGVLGAAKFQWPAVDITEKLRQLVRW